MAKLEHEQDKCPSCGKIQWEYTWNRQHLAPYTILKNRYLLGAVLGSGGFGVTYIGFDTVLNHKIAIKELFPDQKVFRNQDNPGIFVIENARESFEKEKQAFVEESLLLSRSIGTPGICNIIDYFEENRTIYLVEEYLPGGSFKEYLQNRKNHRISWQECTQLFSSLLTGLCHIHSLGIVHCDISPDNLMFDGEGELKLIDFGAARQAGSDGIRKLLKEPYAAPEQYHDNSYVGPWTDLYAVCAVMYQALTGIMPAAAPGRTRQRKPISIAQFVDIPVSIEKAILQGLDPEIQKRYFFTGTLMECLDINTDNIKMLLGKFQSVWGEKWLEVFTESTPYTESVDFITRIRRWFNRDRIKYILARFSCMAGIIFLLAAGVFLFARTHPVSVFRYKVNKAQKKAAKQQITQITPDTVEYEELLQLLEPFKVSSDSNSSARYNYVPPLFFREHNLSSNIPEFYLDLPLTVQLFEYYFDQSLQADRIDNLCFVTAAAHRPLHISAESENRYMYRLSDDSYGSIEITYDVVNQRVCKISLRGQKKELICFLQDIFPFIVPETYLTDDEISELFTGSETSPDGYFHITSHAKYQMSLHCADKYDHLFTLTLQSLNSADFIFN